MPELGIIYNISRFGRGFRLCALAAMLSAVLATGLFGGAAAAGNSASIIIYHRFGEDRPTTHHTTPSGYCRTHPRRNRSPCRTLHSALCTLHSALSYDISHTIRYSCSRGT